MERAGVVSDCTVEVKIEPQEDENNSFVKFTETNICFDLPIPFKEEPNEINDVSTENFLNDVCAAVNANIAEVDKDLIAANEQQLHEARKQMGALQRALTIGKLRKPIKMNIIKRKETSNYLPTTLGKSDHVKNEESDLECDENLLKCIVCKRIFNDQCSLDEHVGNRSSRDNLSCCACEKFFKDNSQLIIHYRKHTGEKPYSCNECNKQFSIKGNLDKHIRTHTGERRFQCSICEKKFFQYAHLDDHIKTHTGTFQILYIFIVYISIQFFSYQRHFQLLIQNI